MQKLGQALDYCACDTWTMHALILLTVEGGNSLREVLYGNKACSTKPSNNFKF